MSPKPKWVRAAALLSGAVLGPWACSARGAGGTEAPTPEHPAQVAASSASLETVDLGELVAGSPYAIHLDGAVTSVTLLLEGDGDAYYAVTQVTRPDGQEIVGSKCAGDAAHALTCGPLRSSSGRGLTTLQWPDGDSPLVQPEPGTWTFTFLTDNAAITGAHGTAIIKRQDPARTPVVNLNLFVAPGALGATTAATANLDPTIKAILERWRFFYTRQAGIALGTVQFYDIDAAFSDIMTPDEYGEMFAEYGRADGINVFLVRSLSLVSNEQVAGVAGNIPGPPGLAHSSQGGVVVEVQDNDVLSGNAVAHEVGHFLGLYHISEASGEVNDPISDTPTCEQPIGCVLGAAQLMFVALTLQQQILTPEQAQVVRANASVK